MRQPDGSIHLLLSSRLAIKGVVPLGKTRVEDDGQGRPMALTFKYFHI
jgi:hypothetical protein